MATDLKGNIPMVNQMGKGNIYGNVDFNLKESSKMVSDLERAT